MKKEDILKKIKKIEIASSIIASEIFSGSYRSYFKGNGMEFSDIRRYSLGDDVKKIDCNDSEELSHLASIKSKLMLSSKQIIKYPHPTE